MFIASGIGGLDELIPGLPKGGLILVAGNPGTGKTIFSAGFIYHGILEHGERGVYASIAEDKRAFYENMRSIGYDFEELEKRGDFRFLSLVTLLEEGASSLISEILNVVESIGARRLVIDPFSAIAQSFKDPREVRVFLHVFLSRVVRRLNCTTILIEEIPFGKKTIGHGFEEFIADAVIILRNLRYEDKLIRELRIAKLRGAEVRNPDICFTLHEGFKVFPPFRYVKPKQAKSYEPIPDPPNAYSTGIPDLDKAIGGYPRGAVILLDIDSRISAPEYRLIVSPTIANFIANRRPVIIIPTAGTTWMDIPDYMRDYGIDEDKLAELTRIFVSRKGVSEKTLPRYVVPYEPSNLEESYKLFTELEEELMGKQGKPALRIVGVDWIAHFWGVEGAISLLNLDVRRIRYVSGLTILLGKPIYPEIIRRASPLATIHLRLTRRHGCILLYGVKPRTPLYSVEADYSRGYIVPRLTPVV